MGDRKKPTGFRRAKQGGSLGDLRPDLIKQWDRNFNDGLTPFDVVPHTHRKIWWRCDAGPDHVWLAAANKRMMGQGCPFCVGKKVSVTNSLETVPELVAQWHPTLNGCLTPDTVTCGSNENVWWKCNENTEHVWRTLVNTRQRHGCPFCVKNMVCVSNSIASVPELAAQWHPTLNGELRPEDVAAGTAKKIWWQCPEGYDHVWEAAGDTRRKGHGCPCCVNQKVSVTNNLENFPELAAQWHPTLNGDSTPADVIAGTDKKIWWQCPEDSAHVWEARSGKRISGNGCPFCAARGYDLTKPGAFYLLCGDAWGKVGVSNVLEKRLKTHEANGVFGSLVLAVHCDDGKVPAHLERTLKAFIAKHTVERAPKVDGFTESFPAWLLGEVRGEVLRVVEGVDVPVTVNCP